MLLRLCHLFCKDTLQRRQLSIGLFQFHKPSLAIRHTGDAIRDAYLRDATELVRKAALGADALAEIPLYLFLCHAAELAQKILQ